MVLLTLTATLGLVTLLLILVLILLLLLILFVFLIFLILLLILVVFLLLILLLLQLFDQLADDLPVFLGTGVSGIRLQHGLVVLECVLPVRQLRLGLLRRLAGADQRIGQVIGRVITYLPLSRGHRLGEIPGGFLVVPGLVGGGPGIEPDLLRRGPLLKAGLEVLQRPLVVPLPVIGETRCRHAPDGSAAKE